MADTPWHRMLADGGLAIGEPVPEDLLREHGYLPDKPSEEMVPFSPPPEDEPWTPPSQGQTEKSPSRQSGTNPSSSWQTWPEASSSRQPWTDSSSSWQTSPRDSSSRHWPKKEKEDRWPSQPKMKPIPPPGPPPNWLKEKEARSRLRRSLSVMADSFRKKPKRAVKTPSPPPRRQVEKRRNVIGSMPLEPPFYGKQKNVIGRGYDRHFSH